MVLKNGDFATSYIVIFIIFISGVTKLFEELKFEKSAEKLNKMIDNKVSVVRNGVEIEINSSEIVVGDIILLSVGDLVPADLRILEARDLLVNQSSLTGESGNVRKTVDNEKTNEKNPLYFKNLIFMGSDIKNGSARAVVIRVGTHTYFGDLSKELSKDKNLTDFDKNLNEISWLIIKLILTVSPIILAINIVNNKNPIESVLFALSVAVSLTPEMFPAVVTTNLIKSSGEMARQRTIVKNLNSMQNFGSMSVLCTDKTGTLTENSTELNLWLNSFGREDESILSYAFYNSYFQTGLKNLIDKSILNHFDENSKKIF